MSRFYVFEIVCICSLSQLSILNYLCVLDKKGASLCTDVSALVFIGSESRRGRTKTLRIGAVDFLPGARCAEELRKLKERGIGLYKHESK